MSYVVEVDQSGKIEDTSVPTVLAFADGSNHAIWLATDTKRLAIAYLKTHYAVLREPYMKLFAAALFLLLKNHLSDFNQIVIDQEYVGHEGDIKGMLLNYIRTAIPSFPKEQITFKRIGKHSPAHQKVYAAYTGLEKPNRIIRSEELIALLGNKKRSGDSS